MSLYALFLQSFLAEGPIRMAPLTPFSTMSVSDIFAAVCNMGVWWLAASPRKSALRIFPGAGSAAKMGSTASAQNASNARVRIAGVQRSEFVIV